MQFLSLPVLQYFLFAKINTKNTFILVHVFKYTKKKRFRYHLSENEYLFNGEISSLNMSNMTGIKLIAQFVLFKLTVFIYFTLAELRVVVPLSSPHLSSSLPSLWYCFRFRVCQGFPPACLWLFHPTPTRRWLSQCTDICKPEEHCNACRCWNVDPVPS